MEPTCKRCGRRIPARRVENARRVGRVALYHSDKCQAAAKQERYRKRAPAEPQARIHLRNLAAHGMIAEKLLRDPMILGIARENLAHWIATGADSPAIREWQRLVESGDKSAIVAALLRVDEEGMRLRSSSPFTNVLSDEERLLIYQEARK